MCSNACDTAETPVVASSKENAVLELIPRATWGMPGPLGPAKVSRPSKGLWLHHTVGTVHDDRDLTVHDDVYGDARSIARAGIDRFGRASYSYFRHPAGPRGQILQMQGDWIGAHTARQNSSSHAVAVHGNFQTREPTDDDLWSLAALTAWGAATGRWPEPVLLGGHRDAPGASTACPGSHLHDAIPDINRLARELYQEDDMNDEQDARLKNIERMVADQLRPTLTRIDGQTRGIREAIAAIDRGDGDPADTLTVVRDILTRGLGD